MGSQEVVNLPESVKKTIEIICQEKKLPPLKNYAKKMLAEIGEEASLDVLRTIWSSKEVTSFSGYISFLVKQDYPVHANTVLSAYDSTVPSPHAQKTWLGDGERLKSPISMSSSQNSSNSTSPINLTRRFSFEHGNKQRRSPSGRGHSHSPLAMSPQLLILTKLEYRRLFLLLSYIKREKLEAAIDLDGANEIISIKDLPMRVFEDRIWNKYGLKFCDEYDRITYLDSNSGKTHLYYCHVDRDGSYYFKGPYLNSTRTHLQRSLGDDNVLIVKFLEDDPCGNRKIFEEGVLVGLRRFQFFLFKDERNRKKKNQLEKEKKSTSVKCYFVRIDSGASDNDDENYILFGKSISEARRLFMHIDTVSTTEKYMARFALILSKTVKLQVDFGAVVIERIEDIPFRDENGFFVCAEGKPLLHTDGTGFISEDLAVKCQKDFVSSKSNKDNSFEKYDEFVKFEDMACQKSGAEARNKEPPLLIQCRLFYQGHAVKGTLLVNKKLERGTIQIRPSMIKVERDPTLPEKGTFNSLEIVTISHKPGRTFLSKNLIALLSYGGVPQEYFLYLLRNALEETRNVYSNRRAALRVTSNHDGLEEGIVAQRMILSGVPLNEPYLQHCLSNLEDMEKSKLKNGKIPIDDSFYVMGTADPTGILNTHQVCVILDNGQISGKVLVYRNPGIHFGDIHILEAVYVKELEEVVGNAKYGIFFSTKGSRSAAYEMASGDFDGDLYWVSRNPELLKYFKASEPWNRVYSSPSSNKRGPRELSTVELERELFQLFLESRRTSYDMATACHSWLTFMDRLLTLGDHCTSEKDCLRKKMIHLIDIYYDALDAPKSGKKVDVLKELKAEKYPHHMGKGGDLSYKSSSILGLIYDRVEAFKDAAAVPVTTKEVWKLSCFEVEIPVIYVNMWKSRYEKYLKDMCQALKCGDESRNEAANEVVIKYKELLYDGCVEMEESSKDTEIIYEEAMAIYHVTYEYATTNGVERCSFAWRVAGSALCNLFAWKLAGPKDKPLVVLRSVLRELLNY
ncbi:hypothetical protein ACJIZ3_018726 [Penstemon smallii]|uniref:RNA-dependent RNA polymerase n=1 Tax=Penstemon smallii TaxID=265156 RepID=A0ABD3SZ74_9LAMI